ncbi:MAG: Ig-like domain-containing protein, partial [Clostridia bacterium]|nr:Ig-like domain-containing protein [Clostridia bacterium]
MNAFRISRNLTAQDGEKGSASGNFYLAEACFTYENACTATTVTPSTASVDYEMGDDWTDPTFTLSVAGTLTYSSSNEDIASVDDDGKVTFNGEAGTVTITASYAGGTISETEYCASSGSYTINVSCPGGAPKIVADGSTDMVGCNTSVTLLAKTQAGGDFADGTYQWFRNGTEIDGATSSSYTATQAGTYTVERTNTSDCTTPSTNSAIVTSETTEPEVERLVPFQYYHVNKTYSDQMKMRHLFAVKNSGTLDGKHFKMYVSRNG